MVTPSKFEVPKILHSPIAHKDGYNKEIRCATVVNKRKELLNNNLPDLNYNI